MTSLSSFLRPDSPGSEYDEIPKLSLMQQTAWKLGNSPIPLNPNVTYRDLTSPQDREILAHLADPEVYANRIAALTKELAEKYADEGTYDEKQRCMDRK